MTRRGCINAAVVISFFAGGLIGVGAAMFLAPALGSLRARAKPGQGRREPLTREQIIEEGLQCAVPEGADICFPEEEESPDADGRTE
jgi:gas vesicle protein